MTRAVEAGELRLSLVVLLELKYGAEKALLKREKRPADRVTKLQRAVPVEVLPVEAALHYGKLRSHLEKRGCVIGAMDMLLAAHALGYGTLWFTFFDKSRMRAILNVAEEKVPLALVLLGKMQAIPPKVPRKDVTDKLSYIR